MGFARLPTRRGADARVIVRQAAEADLPQLLEIARTFVEESRYGWPYSPEVAEHTWRSYLARDDMAVLVADRDGAIVGGAVLAHDRDFTLNRIGYVVKFYILPAHRRTRAAFLVCQAMCEWFDENQCWAAFATSTANIGASEAYVKLMARYGFGDCGPTLMRTAHE